jgi:OmpA-OmpF porin, OOP family
LSGMVGGDFTKPVEGEVTRVLYRVPVGHTGLEVLRNYEQTAKDMGLVQDTEICASSNLAKSVNAQQLFGALPFGDGLLDPYGTHAQLDQVIDGPSCYFSAKGTTGGKTFALQVVVTEKHKVLTPGGGPGGKPWSFKNGEVVVGVDTVTSKALANEMVVVKAADIADALAAKGVFDLYGVYFDTDKTVVKPESTASLDEVASLLKIDRSLKLEVSGHTDNTGDKAHNMTLSQGRADAVKAMLVSKYGIDAKRLVAKGYGDTKPVAPNTSDANKAKNRRVELRKV